MKNEEQKMRSKERGMMGVAVTLLCMLLGTASMKAGAQSVAIIGGTVYTVSGESIEGATVLIEDGEITAVGSSVSVPAGVPVVDASGKWITPGLINASTDIGLVEIGSAEVSYSDDDVSAAFDVRPSINPQSVLIPETRLGGVTTVFSSPTGGIVSGQGVILDLLGDELGEMIVDAPSIMVAHINSGAVSAGHGSRAGAIGRLQRLLEDALLLDARKEDFEQNAMQQLSAPREDVEAMIPVVLGEQPIMITANRQSDIENALALREEFDLDLILLGAREGWTIADTLSSLGLPIVLSAVGNIPSYDGLSARFENPALLAAAGANVVLVNGLASGTRYNVRNLRYAVGNAVSYGMDWDTALRAVTLGAAEALGISDRYGSLDPGKVGNVVIWNGDPFEFSTTAEAVYIRGKAVPMTSRQAELLERYKKLLEL